jgi:hypothetical protein
MLSMALSIVGYTVVEEGWLRSLVEDDLEALDCAVVDDDDDVVDVVVGVVPTGEWYGGGSGKR